MLNKIKLLLGLTNTSKDTLLTELISQCVYEAKLYTHNDSIDASGSLGELETAIIQMVIYRYNRLGTEGVSSEGYSGVSFNYMEDYPDMIYSALRSKRKMRFA